MERVQIGPLHIAVAQAAYDVFVESVGRDVAAELIRHRIGDVETTRRRLEGRYVFGDAADLLGAEIDLGVIAAA